MPKRKPDTGDTFTFRFRTLREAEEMKAALIAKGCSVSLATAFCPPDGWCLTVRKHHTDNN